MTRRRPRHVVFRGEDGWRWHIVASNGQITATSGEAFASRSNARRALRDFRISQGAVVSQSMAEAFVELAEAPSLFGRR